MSTSDLFGGWSLIDYRQIPASAINKDEDPIFPLGTKPQGIISYTSSGVMYAHLSSGVGEDNKLYENASSPHGGTDEERAHYMKNTLAYAGAFTVEKVTPAPAPFSDDYVYLVGNDTTQAVFTWGALE